MMMTHSPLVRRTVIDINLEKKYAEELERLRAELSTKIPPPPTTTAAREATSTNEDPTIQKFLHDEKLDTKFAKFVVLETATPNGLASFANQGDEEASMIDVMLSDGELLIQMLVADGAKRKKNEAAQYGPAMKIYNDIQAISKNTRRSSGGGGVFQRLALAIALEHAIPIEQTNAINQPDAPKTIDPIKRYLHFEKAFEVGELDPSFANLDTWDLRMVVNGDEPNDILAWGRQTLRNFRPDHIYTDSTTWRYVAVVRSEVRYGSENVKYDRPELHKYQNILMNGGVCGRRAFFGRFILRSFGIPTVPRPQTGHAALAHYTPDDGWVLNLGGGWGAGWTPTRYNKDLNFLANAKARINRTAYLTVKRAQWAGEVFRETRCYGEEDGVTPGFWNGVALQTQRDVIDGNGMKTIHDDTVEEERLGEWCIGPTLSEKICASSLDPNDIQFSYNTDDGGSILIPADSYKKTRANARDVLTMKSFTHGQQIFLPSFLPKGTTIMRGGTWKNDADDCTSGHRMLSSGYGKYENWGFRVVVVSVSNKCTASDPSPPRGLTLGLGDGVDMEMVYIQPGTFVMGGQCTADGRFKCVEVPKHQVNITQGYYFGKYPVTQAQYQAVQGGTNPSKSTKAPNCPVDNIGVAEAAQFCHKLAQTTGKDVRLPTEAQWEYACRGGGRQDTRWFFGDDPSQLGDYAWFKDNASGQSHPVGQKKPNPWGLYDIYGNVCERISDTYARNYYLVSPADDPIGPSQGINSSFEYQLTAVPQGGKYLLVAKVATVNYDQRLNVTVNSKVNANDSEIVMNMPFTAGRWQESTPVVLTLEKGENTLQFSRKHPPQYGLAINCFKLVLAK